MHYGVLSYTCQYIGNKNQTLFFVYSSLILSKLTPLIMNSISLRAKCVENILCKNYYYIKISNYLDCFYNYEIFFNNKEKKKR